MPLVERVIGTFGPKYKGEEKEAKKAKNLALLETMKKNVEHEYHSQHIDDTTSSEIRREVDDKIIEDQFGPSKKGRQRFRGLQERKHHPSVAHHSSSTQNAYRDSIDERTIFLETQFSQMQQRIDQLEDMRRRDEELRKREEELRRREEAFRLQEEQRRKEEDQRRREEYQSFQTLISTMPPEMQASFQSLVYFRHPTIGHISLLLFASFVAIYMAIIIV